MSTRSKINDNEIKSTTTAVFQLRNISTWKKHAVLDAMKRTHLATESVIKSLIDNIEEIKGISKKVERTGAMQKIAYKTLRSYRLSGACEASARVDAIGMVESYIQTLDDGRAVANTPTVPDILSKINHAYIDMLDELSSSHGTIESHNIARDEISRVARDPKVRPISLHGYKRYYKILRHQETGRYYAWINILSEKSKYTPSIKEMNAKAKEFNELIDISTGECILCKKPTWILFPLSFGFDYHERRYILSGNPGGGRLVYRPDSDRFELHASFEHVSEKIDTNNRFIGVDVGIHKLASWAVTDDIGNVIETGFHDGLGLRHMQRQLERRNRDAQRRGKRPSGSQKRAWGDEAVHVAANAIVDAAKKNRARVVLEELVVRRRLVALPKGNRGGTGARNLRRVLSRQQYGKLVQIMTYKLAKAGLPPAIEIGAAYTSQTCPECGCRDKENRKEQAVFSCIKCGYVENADINAARVIAIKGAWLLQVPTLKERKGSVLSDDEKFDSYLMKSIQQRKFSIAAE